MRWRDRNRDLVTNPVTPEPAYGWAIDLSLDKASEIGRLRGAIDVALIYLDCGDIDRAIAKLEAAQAISDARDAEGLAA